MSVVNGQIANQTTFNNAFMSRTAATTQTIAQVALENAEAESGANIGNVQRAINKAFEGVGATGEADTTINEYANNHYILDGDSRKVTIEKLDAQLFQTQTDLDADEIILADHETRIDSAELTIIDHETRIDAAELTIIDHETRIDSAELTIIDHETRIDSAELTIIDHETRIDAAELTIIDHETRIDAAELDILDHEDRITDVETAITGLEPSITPGTTLDYWRGDKSWQPLNKSAVGLSNVDNTSDANKPISTATQTALNLKYDNTNPSGYETPTLLNARDAANRSRDNHTGSQLASTISNFASSVLSVLLTGISFATSSAVVATDSILVAIGKLQAQINNIPSTLPVVSPIAGTVIDWSILAAKTGTYTKTLSANTTFTFTNLTAGQLIDVRLTNTASNYTVTWTGIKWAGNITPVMTIGAKTDLYSFMYDGVNIYGAYSQNF